MEEQLRKAVRRREDNIKIFLQTVCGVSAACNISWGVHFVIVSLDAY
jgi:energy-converting hydrogenase Eha subunit H